MPPTNQGLNLINPVMVPLPSEGGRGAGFYKSIILDIVSMLSAFALGYSYHQYLTAGLAIWYVVGALFVFGIFSTMQAFLCVKVMRRAFVIFCEVIMLDFFFYVLDWRFLLASGVCAFIFFFWGYLGSRSEIDYGVEVRPFRASKSVMSSVTTGALLFMVVIYIPLWNQDSIFVSQESFNGFFDLGMNAVGTFIPNLSLSGSLGSFANSLVRLQLQSDNSFSSLSPDVQGMLVSQAATGLIDGLSKNIGIKIRQSDNISTVAYQYIVKMLNGWKNSLQGAFFVGWSVVVFFIARSFGVFFVWIDQFLFFIVYEILLAFRFMKVKEKPWEKEVVEY